jgi:hypothetical protein
MSARRDPALARLASGGPVKVAACFPRAVKWLFHQSGAPLQSDTTEVLNMRTLTAEETAAGLLADEVKPNLPEGRATAAAAEASPES